MSKATIELFCIDAVTYSWVCVIVCCTVFSKCFILQESMKTSSRDIEEIGLNMVFFYFFKYQYRINCGRKNATMD